MAVPHNVSGSCLTVGGTINRETDLQFFSFRSLVTPENQNRHTGAGKHSGRHGAEQHLSDPAAAAASHNDKIRMNLIGLFRDHFRGIADRGPFAD